MENFEFESQICTTRSQSERLLALGLKKETADMMYVTHSATPLGRPIPEEYRSYEPILSPYSRPFDVYAIHIPAWSLHRLMEIMPKNIGCYKQIVSCCENEVTYMDDDCYTFYNNIPNDNLYDGIIECIGWAIVNKYINPQFLEDKK